MYINDNWDIFYDHRVRIATGAVEVVQFPLLKGPEMEVIKYATVSQNNAGARILSLGVFIGGQFYRFFRETTGAVYQPVGGLLELTISEGMRFGAVCASMVAADVIELFVHGFRKKIHSSNSQ